MIGIEKVVAVFPPNAVAATQLPVLQTLGREQRTFFETLGIESVRVADDASASDLAAAATKKLVSTMAEPPDMFILIAPRLPEALVASEALRVMARAGLEPVPAFSVGDLGCASVAAALAIGEAFMTSNPRIRKIVFAHGSHATERSRLRFPVTIHGDCGFAFLMSRTPRVKIVASRLETNPEYADLFRIDFATKPASEWEEECTDLQTYSFKLAVESRNRFLRLNEEVLTSAAVGMESVDHVVMQNLSDAAFAFYEQALDINVAPVCRRNLRSYGHLGPVDVILNVFVGIASAEIHSGDRVLALNNAPVAAWSSMLLEVVPE